MGFYEERETVEKLRENKNNLVFWKRPIPHAKENGPIVCYDRWTTENGYLIGDKLYEIGSDKLLCTTWIDEEYLEEQSKGENIVVVTE